MHSSAVTGATATSSNFYVHREQQLKHNDGLKHKTESLRKALDQVISSDDAPIFVGNAMPLDKVRAVGFSELHSTWRFMSYKWHYNKCPNVV